MKKCPYCAEEIQDAAIVCRYCKRDLQLLTTEYERIKKKKKLLDILANPMYLVLIYLAGALVLSILGLVDVFGANILCIYFTSLFAVYYVAFLIRDKSLSEDEKRKEDDYQSWLSGQRGP